MYHEIITEHEVATSQVDSVSSYSFGAQVHKAPKAIDSVPTALIIQQKRFTKKHLIIKC